MPSTSQSKYDDGNGHEPSHWRGGRVHEPSSAGNKEDGASAISKRSISLLINYKDLGVSLPR